MCSTGPETTPFAKPAKTPAAKSWLLERVFPPGPPTPAAALLSAKTRLTYSRAPNWMETHTPIPSRGVRVPYSCKSSDRCGARQNSPTHLVKSQRTLVPQDASSTVEHTIVCAFRCCLHTLYINHVKWGSYFSDWAGELTTLTISKGWPTSTCGQNGGMSPNSRDFAKNFDLAYSTKRSSSEVLDGVGHGGVLAR